MQRRQNGVAILHLARRPGFGGKPIIDRCDHATKLIGGSDAARMIALRDAQHIAAPMDEQ
jgi:hypothetical protein